MRTAADILAAHRIERVGRKSDYATTCPRCSHLRRKKRNRCLTVKIDSKGVRWCCHHSSCSWSGWEFYHGRRDGADRKPAAPVEANNVVDDDRARIRRARDLWAQSVDPTGTLVERYLAGRGLRLLDGMAGRVVRFHAACPWRDDETEQLLYVPAMITAMLNIRTDQLQAVQVTALRSNGSKISRKMRGRAAGAAVKLVADDMVVEALGITEGFENALAMMLQGWSPIWALGSAGAIEKFQILPGVQCLTIFADHEPAGLAAAQACAELWRSAGAEVAIRVPKSKDWNDAVLGRAAT